MPPPCKPSSPELACLTAPRRRCPARFVRRNGDMDTVARPAVITGEGRPGPGDPLLLQVSRWDRLKDMGGVMRAFADHVVPEGGGYLMLADPAVAEVSDDPEGAAVYGNACCNGTACRPPPGRASC
jgi:trehalose synthase